MENQDVVDTIDNLLQFYALVGTHTTSLFYAKNDVYEKLKARSYAICCACCIRTPVSEDLGELKDALPYKELHAVDKDEVRAYEALKKDDEDERGARAQEAFNIAYVKSEKKYYHVFNIEDPREDNPLENGCCLIKDGKFMKLPVCQECYDRMKKASNYLKEFEEIWDELSENEQQSVREKAIGMLKRLSLKRCDLGRIPQSLGKLSNSGRTAISPFTAYTIIRQLHSSKHLPDSSQHSTKGSKFSVPTDEIGSKEFCIPLSHEEFVNSYNDRATKRGR